MAKRSFVSLLSVMILFSILLPLKVECAIFFDKNATVKELAKQNKLSTSKLIHELEDEYNLKNINSETLVNKLNITKKDFKSIYDHINVKLDSKILFALIAWTIMCLSILYLLKKKKLNSNVRIIYLLVTIVLFGVIYKANPSAMESIVKLFKATAGKDTWQLKIFFFTFFSIFSLILSNLFCSIGCQVGSLQDLIYQLTRKKYSKKIIVPFWITNTLRISLFIAFALFMYDIVSGLSSGSLYHSLNIFKIYGLNIGTVGIITFSVSMLLSFMIYRPYCSVVCPFGLWSWIISHFSFFKIKIDNSKCIECKKCISACPNDAMKSIYYKETIIKDCYSCSECINSCPMKCIDVK